METLVTIGYICICILMFSLAIAIHEWGHMVAALKLGFKVERFSIGFGPVIWKKKSSRSGIEYCVSCIPLGGYVKIPEVDPEGTQKLEGAGGKDRPDAKTAAVREPAPAWKELVVAFAGPFMNLVLAVALALLLACIPSARFAEGLPVLDNLDEIGPVARAGLQRGDRVVSVDGQPVKTWTEMLTEVQLSDGAPVTFVYARGATTNSVSVTPVRSSKGIWSVGASAALPPEIAEVAPEGASAAAGVLPGDLVVAFAGKPVGSWSDFLLAQRDAGAAGGALTVLRAGTNVTLQVKPRAAFAYQFEGPFVVPAVVAEPAPGTVAAEAGLTEGDRVVSFGGAPVAAWSDLSKAVKASHGAASEMVFVHAGETNTVRVTPHRSPTGAYYIAATLFDGMAPVVEAAPDSPAAAAGFRTGDKVVSVGGESVATWRAMERAIHDSARRDWEKDRTVKPVAVEVIRDGSAATVEIVPTPKCWVKSFDYGLSAVECASWMSRRNPVGQLADDASGIFHILRKLVTPRQAAATGKALGGPVIIARGIYLSVRHDFWSGLGFLRFLNVNLAILNLLPIPVLDGGLILFSLLAIVFRRRVPDRIVNTLSTGFMYLLLALMAFLVWRDCGRVFASGEDRDEIRYVTTDHEIEKPDTFVQGR